MSLVMFTARAGENVPIPVKAYRVRSQLHHKCGLAELFDPKWI